MTARTHDAIAFASLITVAAFYQPDQLNLSTLIVAVIAADVGAAIPDLDTAGNRLWHMLPAGERIGKYLRRVFYKHRTITHSLLGGIILYKLLEVMLFNFLNPDFLDPQLILAATMIGFVSHLAADSLTREGIPLFFPLRIAVGIPPIKRFRLRTGKWFENIIVYPAVWLYLLWFIHANQERLIELLRLATNS
jgi:inner membrane protein